MVGSLIGSEGAQCGHPWRGIITLGDENWEIRRICTGRREKVRYWRVPSWHRARLALLVELLLFWRGGVRKACSSSNFCGGCCPGADRRGASGDSRALAVLSGGLSAMPQVVAFGCFIGEAVLGSSAMEWAADGEVR